MSRSTTALASLAAIALCSAAATAAAATEPVPTVAASSGTPRVFNPHPNPALQRKTKDYAINAELGRAWVVVTYDAPSPEDRHDVVRVNVPGLSYDAASGAIVYRSDERSVECARVQERGWGIFKHQKITPTGQCTLVKRYVDVPVDNGFNVDNVRHLEVLVQTNP